MPARDSYQEAIELLNQATASPRDLPDQSWGAAPMVYYTLGWLHEKSGDAKAALKQFNRAAALPPDYCFPARLEEIAVLEAAMRANRHDAQAPYYLGNLLYDRRRHGEAIKLWEKSARLDGEFSIVWRNLGIGYFNVLRQPGEGAPAYDNAFRANPADARLLYERDQLWKRLAKSPAKRLRELEKHPDLVRQRDDLSVEFGALLVQAGRLDEASQLLAARRFQPWEGGEGGPLGLQVRTQLAFGRQALGRHDYASATTHFECALQPPLNLGEARHLLANQSDLHYWLGVALAALGKKAAAREQWRAAAQFKGDFQEMRVRAVSEMTFYSALAWRQLGHENQARKLFRELLNQALDLQKARATIDYFATSLPTMLLFDDDLQYRQETAALFLQAQARFGLGQRAAARALLADVLRRDPNHVPAADFVATFTSA